MNFILLYLLWYTAVIKVEAVVNRFGPGDGFMCHCNDTAEQCDKKSGACQSGCNQEWFGPGCQYRDLAQLQGKTVSQTTDGKSRSAMLAIDNNDNTCSRSGKQGGFINWKIKLPQNETLTELYIRTKKGRLVDFTNYAVYVEYAPQMGEHVTEQCYRANKQRPKSEYFVIRCDRPLIGNQVRIQVEDTDRLVLCDVKINGACQDGTYGPDCNLTCGGCKDQLPCNVVNGSCSNGCDPGFYATSCASCPDGTFGEDCKHNCHCKNGAPCMKNNGLCPNGCGFGWSGSNCSVGLVGRNTSCDSISEAVNDVEFWPLGPVVDCGCPAEIRNGTITSTNGTLYPSMITYSCDKLFFLVGDRTRICQQNGTWSGSDPVCHISFLDVLWFSIKRVWRKLLPKQLPWMIAD